jgi:hypothetical protein
MVTLAIQVIQGYSSVSGYSGIVHQGGGGKIYAYFYICAI